MKPQIYADGPDSSEALGVRGEMNKTSHVSLKIDAEYTVRVVYY